MATLKLPLLLIAFGFIVNQVHSVSFEAISLPHVDVVSNLLINVSSDYSLFVSSKCRSQLSNFGMRLKDRQVDALKILDSWAKFKSGFLHYQPYDFGDYRQCQDTKLLSSVASRYFMLEMHVSSHQDIHNNASQWDMLLIHRIEENKYFPHRFAVCLPSECSIQDLQTILDSYYVSPHVHPFNVSVHSGDSTADDDSLIQRVTPIQVLALLFLGMPVLLTILASVTNNDNKVIQSFNIKFNTQMFFQKPLPNEDARLNFFYLFRVLYTVSGAVGHTIFGLNRESADYLFDIYFLLKHQSYEPPDPGLAISINLVISTLLSLQSLQSTSKKSFLNQFSSRYFRMIPVVTTVNFIFIVLPLIVPRHQGPVSDAIIDYSSNICSRNFHKDLTMTTNFADPHENCNPITWFISLDLQMFLLFFIPLKILSYNPKKGIFVIGVITAAALVKYGLYLMFLIPDHFPIVHSRENSYEHIHEAVELLYMHPITYIAVKGACIFIAIMMFETRKTSEQMSTMNYVYAIVGFIGTFVTFFTVNSQLQNWSRSTQILVTVVFIPVFLIFWMLFVMNSLAKSSIFMKICGSYTMIILSRLSFSLFMVHPVFVIFLQSQQHNPFLATPFNMFMSGITVLIMSLPLSFIIALVVEYPVANLLKLFTSTKRDPNVDSNHNKKQF